MSVSARPAPRAGFVVALLVTALGLRLMAAFRAGIIESDGAYYCWLAASLARGDLAHGLSTVWPPLYPALIAAAALPMRLAGALPAPETLETAARGVSLVMGLALLAPLARLAGLAAGGRAAIVVLAFAAVQPRLVEYSGAALTESTFTALLVAGIAAWCAERWTLAGAAFGLATLSRPEGAAIAAALWLAGLLLPAGGTRLRAGFLAAFALVVLPYAAFVSAHVGGPSIGDKGAYNFWRAYKSEYGRVLPQPTGLSERVVDSPQLGERLPRARVDVVGFVLRAPAVVAGRTLRQGLRLAFDSLPLAAAPGFALLALIGAFVAPWRRLWPAALAVAACVAIYAPFSVDRRFLVPVVPFVLVFAALGVEAVRGRAARAWGPGAGHRVALALVAAVTLGHATYGIATLHGIDVAPEHRAAGLWLRAHAPAWRGADRDAAIMSRKPWVAYYAGAPHAEMPEGGLAETADRMRATDTRVLVIDERWAAPQRPALAPLLYGSAQRAAVIFAIDRPHALRLYRVPPLALAP